MFSLPEMTVRKFKGNKDDEAGPEDFNEFAP